MSDLTTPASEDNRAENLKNLIKQLIKEQQYEGVALLFTSSKEAPRNIKYLPKIAMSLYREVCAENLLEKTFKENWLLYDCAQEMLMLIAATSPTEELLLELLELIEENKSEHVFVSALKALQIVLLRHGDQKPRALEWSLHSISSRLKDFPIPDYIKEGYDNKQKRLLEQDDEVQTILMHYITVSLFYNPLIDEICSKPRNDKDIFRPLNRTKRNVFCCFLVQLLGEPLSLFDLANDAGKKSNTYSLQCAVSLTKGITKCIDDPFFLLSFVENRFGFKRCLNGSKGFFKMRPANIFMDNEKLPLDCLAIYYYMVIVQEVDKDLIPKVYHPLYVMETGLYLVYNLILQQVPALHEKAIFLMEKLLTNLKNHKISVLSLDLEIHKSFCTSLCNLVGYFPHIQTRQKGIQVLRLYILSFEDEGRYEIIKNLLKTIEHHGISGYLATLYKDLVAEALKNSSALPPFFCGIHFRSLILECVCQLPNGVETDLLENSDKIISSLNAVRYFALKDLENRTGFWNFSREIDENYLKLLRQALDLSIAHFKAELYNVERGVVRSQLVNLNLLDIEVTNDKKTKLDLQLDRDKQKNILNQNLCTFDLMLCLLSRTSECLENSTLFKSC